MIDDFIPAAAPSPEQVVRHLRRAHAIALRAVAMGHHPFGALLVGPDHETVLLEQGNVSTVNHAEAVLARTADMNFSPGYLWTCTLYTTVEPCAMCAATQYWANIGRLVYGLDERRLLAFTGASAENPTLDLPARHLFARGQKAILVTGPVPEVEDELAALHQSFWNRINTVRSVQDGAPVPGTSSRS
jgi:tRNA(Arg) A34 adenosine deaminase TadA